MKNKEIYNFIKYYIERHNDARTCSYCIANWKNININLFPTGLDFYPVKIINDLISEIYADPEDFWLEDPPSDCVKNVIYLYLRANGYKINLANILKAKEELILADALVDNHSLRCYFHDNGAKKLLKIFHSCKESMDIE